METTPHTTNLKKKTERSELEGPVHSLMDLMKLTEHYFALRNF